MKKEIEKEEEQKVGINLPAYVRNLLAGFHGITWKECEEIGEKINWIMEHSDWLENDYGKTIWRRGK